MNNKVVMIGYIKDRKLLVVKSVRSARQNMFTLVGGSVEENESLMDACIRESKEEINKDLVIHMHDFEEITMFTEAAASDPDMVIDIHLYVCKKELVIDIKPDLEILEYCYIDSTGNDLNLSSSITNYFIPWAKERGLID